MPDAADGGEFVSLAAALRQPARRAVPLGEPAALPAPPHRISHSDVGDELPAELKLARLAALEAFDRAVPRLLEALARDVLARELTVMPVDIVRLAADLRATFAAEGPVGFVVAPAEVERFGGTFPVRADPALQSGDLILEVHDGEIDARFATRRRLAAEAALGQP